MLCLKLLCALIVKVTNDSEETLQRLCRVSAKVFLFTPFLFDKKFSEEFQFDTFIFLRNSNLTHLLFLSNSNLTHLFSASNVFFASFQAICLATDYSTFDLPIRTECNEIKIGETEKQAMEKSNTRKIEMSRVYIS